MTTAQPNPVELAKQGNVRAIAFLINRSLQSKGVVARPVLRDGCLQIMLEATQLPDEQTLAPFIHKGVKGLEIASVRILKIYGRQAGTNSPCWSQEFNLQEQSTLSTSAENQALPLQSQSPHVDALKQPDITVQQQVKQTKTTARDQVLLKCKGENGHLTLTETKLIIKRTGGFLSPYKKGEKHIFYTDILDFQYQRANLLSPGYIYFQVLDLAKEVTFLEANGSENAVTFLNERVKDFDKAKEILIQKVNPRKYDNVFEGRSGTLILTETGVTIKRSGGLLSSHGTGEKNIPYKSITAVQFKTAGLTVGFIQLTLKGGVEAKGGAFEAVTDENTVTFGTEEKTREFEKAKSIIEQKIISANSTGSASSNNNDLDQLEKLASLKDKRIISEEEFQAKKKIILGL
jgi:hypothetical protein